MANGDYAQMRAKCRVRHPSAVLRDLVELMVHPISQNATPRHIELLKDFLNGLHYAFWLHDIPHIIRLYEVITRRFEQVPEFRQPLECLLYFSAVPPMLAKPSDMLEYARDAQEYFSILGYLILCLHDNENLSKLVLEAIINLLERPSPVGYCCIPLDNLKEAAARSKLPETLAQLLHVINDGLYSLLLEATFAACQISKFVCEKIAQENAVEYILQRLEPSWRERDLETKPNVPSAEDSINNVELICCILWKLLSVVDYDRQVVQTPTKFALWSFQYALRWSNLSHIHLVDRNNLAAIALKLLDTFPDLQFVESELAEDIAVLVKTTKGPYVSHTPDAYLQFQFRKILFACLHYYKQFKAEKTIQQNQLVKYFTKFLYKEYTKEGDGLRQYCELTQIVLKLIPKYITESMEHFLHFKGPSSIMTMVEHYTQKTYETELLEAYLYCIHEILSLNIDDFTDTFGELGTFTTVLFVCRKILTNPILTRVHQKCLSRAFCILHILGNAGYSSDNVVVDSCLSYLKRVTHPNENDPIFDPRMSICVIQFLWDNVILTYKNYTEFLKDGGIYALLDVTESSSYVVQCVSLGAIADVSKMSISLPYLITWRKRGLKLVPMLLQIFRGPKLLRCDNYEPVLASDNSKTDNTWMTLCQGRKANFPNCCAEMATILRSCRSRIYGILHSLKVKYKEKVEFINEFYKIYTETLNADNQITMLFAENYLSLSMCETWMTLSKELKNEGITPIDVDNDYLVEKIQQIRQWRKFLRFKIEDIINNEARDEQLREKETYILLNEARLSDALDALTELRFLSSCTEKMFQITKKLKLNQDTDVQRSKITNYHSTNLPFPNTYNQIVNIQSNIIKSTNEEPFDISAVSSPGSSESPGLQDSEDNLSERIMEC